MENIQNRLPIYGDFMNTAAICGIAGLLLKCIKTGTLITRFQDLINENTYELKKY